MSGRLKRVTGVILEPVWSGPRLSNMVVKYARALALGLLIVLPGCGSDVSAGGGDNQQQLDGAWKLVEGETAAGVIRPADGYPITFSIQGTEAGGVSGCNQYGARLRQTAAAIKVTQLSATEVACSGAVGRSEAGFMDALLSVTTSEVAESRLTLTGPQTRLVFEPMATVPIEEVVGTDWVLDSLLFGDTSSSPSNPAHLILSDDATFEGTTGCRRFMGEYVIRGGMVQATSLNADLPGGGAVVARCRPQDSHVLSVLGDGFRVQLHDGSMTILARADAGLVYRAK